MATEYSIELTPEAKAAMARVRGFPLRLGRAVAQGLDTANEVVKGRIERQRLDGKGPFPVAEHRLGKVTGKLVESFHKTPAQVISDSGKVVQVSTSLGASIKYAAAHEFGYQGRVQVRSFTRKNPRGDVFRSFAPTSLARAGRKTKTQKKVASGVSTVKAHTRKMNIPARAPIRTGIEENIGVYNEEVSKAVVEELGGTP
jgi:hypothetical protein